MTGIENISTHKNIQESERVQNDEQQLKKLQGTITTKKILNHQPTRKRVIAHHKENKVIENVKKVYGNNIKERNRKNKRLIKKIEKFMKKRFSEKEKREVEKFNFVQNSKSITSRRMKGWKYDKQETNLITSKVKK